MATIQNKIALDPGAGGLCIPIDSLAPADIIISTTTTAPSFVIRIALLSVVSHASLYCGDGQVVEAISSGVGARSLGVSLADDSLAVAYRNPKVTPAIASAIIQYAKDQIGKPYAYGGAALSSVATLAPTVCTIIGSETSSFFCSQLVVEAFRRGGAPLTTQASGCVTPDGLASIAVDNLVYVGHLKGDPSWSPMITG